MLTRLSALARRRQAAKDEEGIAMLMVIASALVLTILTTASFQYALSNIPQSRRDADFQGALSAAEAGIDDYVSHLNQNATYWITPDCANPAMKGPANANGSCLYAGQPTWVRVPGQVANNESSFHYDVDASATPSTGAITVTATGRVRNVDRTVRTVVRRKGVAEFLYYSDIESVDPANTSVYGDTATAQQKCAHHFWDTTPRDQSYCKDIQFVTGDSINGPVHTNDALLINGSPTYNGTVETSWPSCQPANGVATCYRDGGSATPRFRKSIVYSAQLDLQATVAGDKAQATAGLSNGPPGCLYTGPTRIVFKGDGTMDVWSPYSQGTLNPSCGTAPITDKQNVPIPSNNVIYVQSVPQAQAAPAGTAACAAGSIGGLPQSGDLNTNYQHCRDGDVWVEGTVKGRVSVASENNIVITDNLTYAGGLSGSDVLGLLATNYVQVYHPLACTTRDSNGNCTAVANMSRLSGGTFQAPMIQAAIQALAHSFIVQLYQYGAQLDTIHVSGAIAQKYRGPVGTFGGSSRTGYFKDYNYDTRLRFAPPPYFLDPVQTRYGVYTFSEQKAAY